MFAALPVAQLAVAWTLTNPAVDVAIVMARRAVQIEQTTPTADLELRPGTLSEVEWNMRDATPIGGPSPEGVWSRRRALPLDKDAMLVRKGCASNERERWNEGQGESRSAAGEA